VNKELNATEIEEILHNSRNHTEEEIHHIVRVTTFLPSEEYTDLHQSQTIMMIVSYCIFLSVLAYLCDFMKREIYKRKM
jgi:hypothetical protein